MSTARWSKARKSFYRRKTFVQLLRARKLDYWQFNYLGFFRVGEKINGNKLAMPTLTLVISDISSTATWSDLLWLRNFSFYFRFEFYSRLPLASLGHNKRNFPLATLFLKHAEGFISYVVFKDFWFALCNFCNLQLAMFFYFFVFCRIENKSRRGCSAMLTAVNHVRQQK